MAQPFDLKKLTVGGEPTTLADHVYQFNGPAHGGVLGLADRRGSLRAQHPREPRLVARPDGSGVGKPSGVGSDQGPAAFAGWPKLRHGHRGRKVGLVRHLDLRPRAAPSRSRDARSARREEPRVVGRRAIDLLPLRLGRPARHRPGLGALARERGRRGGAPGGPVSGGRFAGRRLSAVLGVRPPDEPRPVAHASLSREQTGSTSRRLLSTRRRPASHPTDGGCPTTRTNPAPAKCTCGRSRPPAKDSGSPRPEA